ncbi:MAG: DUF4381 domain-containing protein, partial [Candidatus Competibacterales bacterium]|nr:DUF4381 domain-containing protein [Candidatus Competibacterales bacterium]
WWLLALAGLVLLALGLRALYRYWRRRRRRQRVLAQLTRCCAGQPAADRTTAIARLLKRAALLRHGAKAAALYGEDWLRFLDATGGAGRFSAGPGRALLDAPYRPGASVDLAALEALARDWLQRNL